MVIALGHQYDKQFSEILEIHFGLVFAKKKFVEHLQRASKKRKAFLDAVPRTALIYFKEPLNYTVLYNIAEISV